MQEPTACPLDSLVRGLAQVYRAGCFVGATLHEDKYRGQRKTSLCSSPVDLGTLQVPSHEIHR